MGRGSRAALAGLTLLCLGIAPAIADNWTARMTVDNQYGLYHGAGGSLTFVATDTNWTTTDTWTFSGMAATDGLYVTTASDRAVAQGFLGYFQNTTQGYAFRTGGAYWDVFPAGRYLLPLFGMSGAWPANVLPTFAQTDAAIQYADTNGLWEAPDKFTNWDNRVSGNVTVWGHQPIIPANAEWIWNLPPGSVGNPFQPGGNHEEFLIFRVRGTPEPTTATLLALGGFLAMKRRREWLVGR